MTVSHGELQNSVANVSARFLELVASYDDSPGYLNTMGVELSGLMPDGYSIGLSVLVELDLGIGVEFGSVHVFQQGSRTHDFKTYGVIADVGTPPISAGVELHFVKGGGEDLRGGWS